MQRHLHGQARRKPPEIMGPFPIETAGMLVLLVHRLHDLAHPSQPTPEPLRPRRPAIALGRADASGAHRPATMSPGWPAPRNPYRRHTGRRLGPHTRQTRLGRAAEGKERLRQGVILRPRSPKPAAGDHPTRVDRQEEMEAPHTSPVGGASPRSAKPGNQPAPRRFASRVGMAALSKASYGHCGPLYCPRWRTRHQGCIRLTHLAVAWLPHGQRRTGGPPRPLGIAIQPAFTAKALPWSKMAQGTTALRGRAAWGPGGVHAAKRFGKSRPPGRQEWSGRCRRS